MANIVNPDQSVPIGAVCSGSMLFASILNSSVILGNYLQQHDFSSACFFLGALRRYFFCGSFMFLFCLLFAMSLCASVYMCFVVTCWERADLLALV